MNSSVFQSVTVFLCLVAAAQLLHIIASHQLIMYANDLFPASLQDVWKFPQGKYVFYITYMDVLKVIQMSILVENGS